MQHLRALFQFRVLPAESGEFLIGVATRMQAGLWAGGGFQLEMTGGLSARTVSVYVWIALACGEPVSVAVTVNVYAPATAGFQVITPVVGLIEGPLPPV